MRTTIRLDDELLNEVKQYAVRSGKTLTAVIDEALRHMLSRQQKNEDNYRPIRLITSGHGGLLPGVDLDDSANLIELMERFERSEIYADDPA